MEMNPQRVRSAEFKTVRKGADPDEVRVFLGEVADELERAQNQSTAMEARARAAVARLQELSETPPPAAAPAVDASVEESETISRTLLLAQRTADQAVAGARAEAEQILRRANDEAAKTLDSTREMSSQILEEARIDARKVGETARHSVASEVEALKARRDFLESDVHHLETFLADQRSRVREAASSLLDVAERVPGGLGEVRSPLLSASNDEIHQDIRDQVVAGQVVTDQASPIRTTPATSSTTTSRSMPCRSRVEPESADLLIVTEIAADDDGEVVDSPVESADDAFAGLLGDAVADGSVDAGDPTEAIPVFGIDDEDASETAVRARRVGGGVQVLLRRRALLSAELPTSR